MQLAKGQESWPRDHGLFLVEEEFWDDVREGSQPGQFSVSGTGLNLLARLARLDSKGPVTIRGIGAGRFRFKVFPGDLAVEPAEIVVEEGLDEPVLLRWSRVR